MSQRRRIVEQSLTKKIGRGAVDGTIWPQRTDVRSTSEKRIDTGSSGNYHT